jgi:hypothetical protein
MTKQYVVNRAAVAHEAFDEETVLINFERGTYFSLRQSAPAIWELLQTPVTAEALLASLGALPAGAPDAVIGMLDQLCEEGCLLHSDIDDIAARDPCVMPVGDFVPPVVEAFHDLTVLMGIEYLPLRYEQEINVTPTPGETTAAMAD